MAKTSARPSDPARFAGTGSPPAPGGASVADLLTPYLITQCSIVQEVGEQLRTSLDGRTRASTHGPPDRVHDGRVACRRLRSTITVFADFLNAPQAARLLDDAGWYAARLGAIRDLDVLGERIGGALHRLDDDLVLHEAAAELDAQLAYRRQIALAELRDAIHAETYADLIDQLGNWQQQPPLAAGADAPARKIRKPVKLAEQRLTRRLRTAAAALAADDPDSDDLVHRARKSAKRLRYAAELADPVLGPHAVRRLATLGRLQELLGDYQDSRIASVLLRDLGGVPGRNGFTFGLLYAQEAQHRHRLGTKIVKWAHRL